MRMPPPVALTGDPDERNYKSEKFTLGSLTTITLYHDYICPWCWVGWVHSKRLTEEFGVTFDWRGAELIPPSMDYNTAPPKPHDPNEPPRPPSRFDKFLETEGIPLASPRPRFVRSHAALLGAEFARQHGDAAFDSYNEAVYRAFWERHEDISDIEVLVKLASGTGISPDALRSAIQSEEYVDNILPFDDDAYRIGIRHVPTFIFNGEELLAEAPYKSLADATERFLIRSAKFKKDG